MSDDVQTKADQRLEAALAATGARDPREFYRERLRELKDADRSAYEEAVGYYRDTLVPAVAGGADPLPAWTEYGRRLATLTSPGRTMMVDRTGASRPYEEPAPQDELILHFPTGRGAGRRALVVGLPSDLSRAQRASYDLLVAGKLTLKE
jgi:hypothetical protein